MTDNPLQSLFKKKQKNVDGQDGYVKQIALCRILVELEMLAESEGINFADCIQKVHNIPTTAMPDIDFTKRDLEP